MTDVNGEAIVNGYNVSVSNETAPIENAYIEMLDGKISVTLPEGSVIAIENRITVTVTDADNAPVKDMSVTVTDTTEKSETNLTDENGKAVVPPTNIDVTDINGYGELNEFAIVVKTETAPVEKADISIDENNAITVLLPEAVKFDHNNRISVEVKNKADGTPVKDISVTVSEADAENTEATEETTETVEPKTLNGKTDKNGLVVFPPLSEDITDGNGNSDITDTEEKPGTDNDGDVLRTQKMKL